MSTSELMQDTQYAAEFEGWYDRVFPHGPSALPMVEYLAAVHPDTAAGTLELGVGTGRIAIPLSERVGPVVGVDLSQAMLDRLREYDTEGRVQAVQGDMRTYRDDRTYGLVYIVCSGLSLLLTEEEQQEALHRAAERVAPGGRLVIEAHHAPGCLALHEGRQHTSMLNRYPDPNTALLTHMTVLPGNLWSCDHVWFESDGTHRIGSETIKLLTRAEVDGMAEKAGLEPMGHSGDPFGTPLTESSGMLVAVYGKAS